MRRHAFHVVGGLLGPAKPAFRGVQRVRNFLGDAGACRGAETFDRQRLHTLDHDGAQHLDGRGAADLGADKARGKADRLKACSDSLHILGSCQHRGFMPPRCDRCHDRHIDIGCAGRADGAGCHLLGSGGTAVHVQPQGVGLQMPCGEACRLGRLVGGNDADHYTCRLDSFTCAVTGNHACPFYPPAHGGGDVQVTVGQLDVMGAHAVCQSAGGQSFGDRKSGLAKSDECK